MRKIPAALENPLDSFIIEFSEFLSANVFEPLNFTPNDITHISLIFGLLSIWIYYRGSKRKEEKTLVEIYADFVFSYEGGLDDLVWAARVESTADEGSSSPLMKLRYTKKGGVETEGLEFPPLGGIIGGGSDVCDDDHHDVRTVPPIPMRDLTSDKSGVSEILSSPTTSVAETASPCVRVRQQACLTPVSEQPLGTPDGSSGKKDGSSVSERMSSDKSLFSATDLEFYEKTGLQHHFSDSSPEMQLLRASKSGEKLGRERSVNGSPNRSLPNLLQTDTISDKNVTVESFGLVAVRGGSRSPGSSGNSLLENSPNNAQKESDGLLEKAVVQEELGSKTESDERSRKTNSALKSYGRAAPPSSMRRASSRALIAIRRSSLVDFDKDKQLTVTAPAFQDLFCKKKPRKESNVRQATKSSKESIQLPKEPYFKISFALHPMNLYVITAAICYFLQYVFDCVDGYYARRMKMETLLGDFYDHGKDLMCFILFAGFFLRMNYWKFQRRNFPRKTVVCLILVLEYCMCKQLACQQAWKRAHEQESPMFLFDSNQGGEPEFFLEALRQALVGDEYDTKEAEICLKRFRFVGCGTFCCCFCLFVVAVECWDPRDENEGEDGVEGGKAHEKEE